MRTAICFSGKARFIEYTNENILQNLILPMEKYGDVDIFVHTSDDADGQYIKKIYSDRIKKIVFENDSPIEEKKIQHMQRNSLQNLLQMFYTRYRVSQIMSAHASDNNIEYTHVIHSRMDVRYFNSIDLYNIVFADMSFIHIPDFHCWSCVQGKGYNDRFFISNFDNAMYYFDLYKKYEQYSKEGHILHAESTLYYHLNKMNIDVKFFPFRFTRVRAGGVEEDSFIADFIPNGHGI